MSYTKLGSHVRGSQRNGFGELCEAKPALVLEVDQNVAEEAWIKSDRATTVIFRTTKFWTDFPGLAEYTVDYAARAAEYWWPKLRKIWSLNPANYYQITNEHGGQDPERHRMTIAFERGIMQRANAEGFKVCVLNLAGGTPADFDMWREVLLPFIRDAHAAGNIYGRHAYGGPTLWPPSGNTGRPFDELPYLRDFGGRMAVTELGLNGGYGYVGDHEFVVQAKAWDARAMQEPNLIGGALWELNTDKKFKAQWQTAIPELAAYIRAVPDNPLPPPPEPPTPPTDTIDLAQFIVGMPGIQHVLQCDFGDYFQGTQTLCTLPLGFQIYAQQKDTEQEIIYYDDRFIYRDTDTSPGDHDGRKAFYCQYQDGKRGAYWCDRFVKVGDVFERVPDIRHFYFDDCVEFAGGMVPSRLQIEQLYQPGFYFHADGYYFDAPVVEIAWVVDGRIIERYFYGQDRGLIGWKEEERGWKSYLVEEHADRIPMPAPEWPPCHQRSDSSFLFYDDVIPVPEPGEGYVRVVGGIGHLNFRIGPGTNYEDIGDLEPMGGPLEIVGKEGKWYKLAAWAHSDYLVHAETGESLEGD